MVSRFDNDDLAFQARAVPKPGPGEFLVVKLPKNATHSTFDAVRDAFRSCPWYEPGSVLTMAADLEIETMNRAALVALRDGINRALEERP